MTTPRTQSRRARAVLVTTVLALAVMAAACTSTESPGTLESLESAGPIEAPGTVDATDQGDRDGSEPLLTVVTRRDGDSFVASDGVEYRVGLVNTPELSECGGHEASDRTYALLERGFTAESYARDTYNRQVARIHVDGQDLGVVLAAEGLANDRYLERFRHENPDYAAELDDAFAQARQQRTGLYQTCWHDDQATDDQATDDQATSTSTGEDAPVRSVPSPVAPDGDDGAADGHAGRTGSWSCHPAYVECLPDGPDLDCADVGHTVHLFGRDDPYRLDGRTSTASDGVGCESYAPWSPDADYPYYRAG